MPKKAPRKAADPAGPAAAAPAGEPAEGSLPTDPELEAALREAADAVDERARSEAAAPDASGEDDETLLIEPADREPSEDEVDRIRIELIEVSDKNLRLQADFENFRRRAHKERQELVQFGHENLVKDLLSTVDNLDRAIEHAQQSDGGDLESLLQGVELLQRELHSILVKHSVSEIEAMGQIFDPALHEAMAQTTDGSVPPNTVIEVLQKGYQLRGRLLRASRVVLARVPEEEKADEESGGEEPG